jgi:membrane protease YdiL (CAAX protease family)
VQTTAKSARSQAPFLLYVAGFHLAWIAWPFLVYPRLIALGQRTLTYAILNITLRLLVWVAPVYFYLRVVDGVEPVQYLKLRPFRRRALWVAAILTTINIVGSFVRFGIPHPSMDRVTWNSVLGTSLLIGFIEEIPYRGFMLQKFAERTGFWIAALISSGLFVAIHVPGWLALHTFRTSMAVGMFVFGAVMTLAFRYSNSLWAPILAHSANDCLSFIIYHL